MKQLWKRPHAAEVISVGGWAADTMRAELDLWTRVYAAAVPTEHDEARLADYAVEQFRKRFGDVE